MSPRPVFKPFKPVALVAKTKARLPAELFPLTEQLGTCIKYQQIRQAGVQESGRQEAPLSLADRVGLATIP